MEIHSGSLAPPHLPSQANKKTDVADHPEGVNHIGLLINEPPSAAGLLFI
jgi:hypothetical protein